MGTEVLLPKGPQLPQFSAHVPCGQTAGWIKMPLGMGVAFGPGDFVLDGDPAPQKTVLPRPDFRPMSIVAKRLDGSRCHLVRPTRYSVRWEPTSPCKRGTASQFLARVYCGQTAGCIIRIPFGQIVLDVDPAPRKGAQPPIFGPRLLWPSGRPCLLLLSTCF